MRTAALSAVLAMCCAGWAQTRPAAGPAPRVIEDAAYRDDAAARAAWRPMEGSPPVSVVEVEGRRAVKFPCRFRPSGAERCYWDKSVRLDLSAARGIQFEMDCPDVEAVSHFTLYLQSGGGWYACGFGPTEARGWGTVRVERAGARTEGTPAGWGRIERIRISPWRGGDVDTALCIRDMRVIEQDGPIAVLSGVSVAAADKREMESVTRFTRSVTDRLDERGLAYAIVNDTGLTPGTLLDKELVNRRLEIDSMVEVATKYDVDGIHFDYIRYPGPECCFCPGCRGRFEQRIGRKVANWPRDVQEPGQLRDQWLEFRRSNITAVVAAVSEAARKVRPKIQISAAVFPSWTRSRDSEGQDWKTWCDKGYLDFVCPMDYTEYTGLFAGQVRQQVQWAGKVPCYPGIGLSCWKDRTNVFRLFEQIEVTRRFRTGGFTIFDYEPTEAKDIVPLCGLGITRKQ